MKKARAIPAVALALLAFAAGAWWLANAGEERIVATGARAPEADEPTEVDPSRRLAPAGGTERAAVSPDERAAGADFVVLAPDGAPLAGVELALGRGAELLAAGTTDGAGVLATGVAEEGRGSLLVLAPARAPELHDVALTPGRHTILLRAGAAVAGHLVVDGRAPGTSMPLRLRLDRPLLERTIAPVLAPLVPTVLRAHAAPDGTFRIDGLPGDVSGALELTSEFRLVDLALASSRFEPASLRLDRPRADLVVELVRVLVLTGRVVERLATDPVPVPNARVEPRIAYGDPAFDQAFPGWEVAGADGRFRLALRASSVRGGRLVLSSPDPRYQREVELEARQLVGDWNLGDLALCDEADTRTLSLREVDTEGQPVEGAVAGTSERAPISAPTDDDGQTELPGVVPGLATLVVYRSGYEVTTVLAPAEPPRPLEVVLRRGTLLEVRLSTPDGEPAARVRVRLAADRHPLRDELRHVRSVVAYEASGSSLFLASREGDEHVIRLHSGRTGRVRVNDLLPGVPLALRVEGRFGTTVHTELVAPLRPGEHRTLDVVLARAARTLRGRVLDEDGRALPGAAVGIAWVPPGARAGTSLRSSRGVDERGAFVFRDVYAEHVDLFARADGFVPLRHTALAVPEDERELELVLAPARAVTVIVEDERGTRLEASVRASLPTGASAYGSAVPGAPGTYVLRGLPDATVEVLVVVYGVEHGRAHDSRDPRLVVTLPVLGALEAAVHRFGDPLALADCRLALRRVEAQGTTVRHAPLAPLVAGRVLVPGLAPGRWSVVVERLERDEDGSSRRTDASRREDVDVRAGETAFVELWP